MCAPVLEGRQWYLPFFEGDTGPVQCVCWKEPSGEFYVLLLNTIDVPTPQELDGSS